MFKIGDTFVYGSNGVCKITDIKSEKFARETKTYYILSPFFDSKEAIFVPVDNETLISKMKALLSKGEIMELIKSIPTQQSVWNENTNTRRELFKKIINKANRTELISLMKTLHDKKQAQEAIGKSLSVLDEKYYRKAQNIIHGEIALVLEMQPAEVEPFIEKVIEAA